MTDDRFNVADLTEHITAHEQAARAEVNRRRRDYTGMLGALSTLYTAEPGSREKDSAYDTVRNALVAAARGDAAAPTAERHGTARCEGCGRFAPWLTGVGDGDDTGMVGPCCAPRTYGSEVGTR